MSAPSKRSPPPVAETHPLITCIWNDNLETLEQLLSEYDINGFYPCKELQDMITPLMAAVAFSKERIVTFLLERRANPNKVSQKNMTALHYVLKCNASLSFVKHLLESNCDPNIGPPAGFTALQWAALCDREDIVKLLISAGAEINLMPKAEIFEYRKLFGKICKFASEGNELCTKVKSFLELEITFRENLKSPEEIFQMFHNDMMKEHPQFHYIIIEWLLNINPVKHAEKYKQLSIKWLKDNGSLHSYYESFVTRFSNLPKSINPSCLINTLLIVCTFNEVPLEQTEAIIPQLLQCLKDRPDLSETVIETLYMITQKTTKVQALNTDLIETLCKSIAPFVNDEDSDIRAYTYGVFANLLPHKHSTNICRSLEICSVPEHDLIHTDLKRNTKLKEALIRFNNHFNGSNSSETKGRWHQISKRWKEKLEKLHSSEQSVSRIESIKYMKELLIAKGSDGTEVFVGLRSDGTEVAVKRMTNTNYQALKNEEGFLRLPELNHPSIVRYFDFAEDDDFGYLALELCEYTLEEYLGEICTNENSVKELVHQFLHSLKVLHSQEILHRDLKPQNVLIDINGRAKLADFGISRRLPSDQTTLRTASAGTRCWMATETLTEEDSGAPYKSNTDIQVAGMLIYYILSGGHHPFGNRFKCEANIFDGKYSLEHVKDVVAKHLIEWMINKEPNNRPNVEQCLSHPYFWTKRSERLQYLIHIGDQEEIVNYKNPEEDLMSDVKECVVEEDWKTKFPEEIRQKMDKNNKYPDNTLALLRFIRNLHVHHKNEAAKVDVMELFPHLFISIYKLAIKRGWRTPVEERFQREEGATVSVNPNPAKRRRLEYQSESTDMNRDSDMQ